MDDGPAQKRQTLYERCSMNEGYGNWWLLSGIRRLPAPVPCRGNVGMWWFDDELAWQVDGMGDFYSEF